MCELFGLSSDMPVQPRELLCRFGAHGGDIADNPDGWGLARLADGGFAIEKEPHAAARSARFRELCAQARSSLILAHVRKANPPTARVLANTHPFRRVCCGREWVFAHNGIIPDAAMQGGPDAAPVCTPAGSTDSEHAFCVVLDNIASVFSAPIGPTTAWMQEVEQRRERLPRRGPQAMDGLFADLRQTLQGHAWLDALARTAEMLASHGRFNFLMSDGEHLIAYGHDRLHSLDDASVACCDDTASAMAIIATEPLTDDPKWRAFEPGELRVYRAGQQIARFLTRPQSPTPAHDAGPPRAESVASGDGRPASSKNGVAP